MELWPFLTILGTRMRATSQTSLGTHMGAIIKTAIWFNRILQVKLLLFEAHTKLKYCSCFLLSAWFR
jgi:hypothetical protein